MKKKKKTCSDSVTNTIALTTLTLCLLHDCAAGTHCPRWCHPELITAFNELFFMRLKGTLCRDIINNYLLWNKAMCAVKPFHTCTEARDNIQYQCAHTCTNTTIHILKKTDLIRLNLIFCTTLSCAEHEKLHVGYLFIFLTCDATAHT